MIDDEQAAWKGKYKVLCDLLRECDAVLETIVPEDMDEDYKMQTLRMAIAKCLFELKCEGIIR